MKTFTLHLIRHGLTQGNLDGLYVGSGTDLPLCGEGIAQLDHLRQQFTYPEVEIVFTSPMLRAKQTAEQLFGSTRQLEIPDLREAGFGCFEGKPVKELVQNPDFVRWMDPTSGFTPEGAEPTLEFHQRCGKTLMGLFEFMMRAGHTEAACVTHGGVIMSMLAQKALPQRKPEDWMADPGCGYTLRADVAMWMRDGLVEAVDIVPFGYLD